jgi:uracil-DNA glycosylase family 4
MGHFFTKVAKAQGAVKKPPVALTGRPNTVHKARQGAATLNRLGCSACPLNACSAHTPKMQPTLAEKTLIYFLGDAPGEHDDEKSGNPLTGTNGIVLRSLIPDTHDGSCSFDNCVRDRPEGDKTTWQELECCRGYVSRSIEEAKPALIVGLGPIPCTWMLGTADLKTLRGRFFAVKVGSHPCWFLPTYHPKEVIEQAYNKKRPLQSRLGFCFRMDIERAFEATRN